MNARGTELEGAIRRAAISYRKEGRALLIQQYPRVSTGSDGRVFYSSTAAVDFLGCHAGGRALAIECKMTKEKSFPLANLDEDQRGALQLLHDMGVDCKVAIEFVAAEEIYVVPWFQVAAFIEAPYRKSLSLVWCRAFGQLAPQTSAGTPQRRALFLDAAAHPDMDVCTLEVWDERSKHPVISLESEDEEPEEPGKPWVSAYAGLTKDEISKRLEEAMFKGIENQLKASRRKWSPGRRRAP